MKEVGASGFITKDSGQHEEYPSGMKRDVSAGKPRFDLLLPIDIPFEKQMLTRFAALMERGAKKYDERNWEKANSLEEYDRARESAFRHMVQWMNDEQDEDHAAAVMFNLMAAETIIQKIPEPEETEQLEFICMSFNRSYQSYCLELDGHEGLHDDRAGGRWSNP